MKAFVATFALMLLASSAEAQKVIINDDTPANVATSTTQVLAANTKRTFLALINDSDTVIYCRFGSAAVLNRGFRLNANGGSLLLDQKFIQSVVNCIHGDSGSKVLLVNEGVQNP